MLKINYQSYPAKSFIPSPFVLESSSLLCIVTPWNTNKNEAQALAQLFKDHYMSFSLDTDLTRIYQPKSFLSKQEDNLHSIYIKINKTVFLEKNKEELNLGFEVVLIIKTSQQVLISQVGRPAVYLERESLPLQPIHPASSLSTLHSTAHLHLDPLPLHLFGIDNEIPTSITSINIKEQDHLILVNRNYVPSSFIQSQNRSLKSMVSILAEDNEKLPFWLARIQI